jgi:hypothetical protein
MITYEFPARGEMPPLKLIWYDGNLRPPRPPELEEDQEMGDNGHLLIGDNGKILSHRGQGRRGFQLIPQKRAKEYGDPSKKLPRSIGHHKEWIAACKGGQPAGSNFAWAGPLTEAVLLGNIALRPELREELTMKKLLWDGPQMRFTNCDAANKFLRSEYRKGWAL